MFFWLMGVRRFFSKVIYWTLRKTIFRGSLPNYWDTIKNHDMKEFSLFINMYPFKRDPLWGLLDYTIQEPDFFFLGLKHSRDCDDFAQMWYWWAKENGYSAWLVMMYDKWKLNSGHMTCIIYKEGQYHLADFHIKGKYSSFEEAMEQFKNRELLSYGKYKNLRWKIYAS